MVKREANSSFSADRIKCYQCTPDPQRGELCANPTNISTCEWYFDSCMSVSMTGKMPDGSAMAVAAMGCGVTGACDQHPGTVCDYANATGMVDQCLVSCCQGDLCNSEAPSAQPTMVVTSTSEDPTTFPPEGKYNTIYFKYHTICKDSKTRRKWNNFEIQRTEIRRPRFSPPPSTELWWNKCTAALTLPLPSSKKYILPTFQREMYNWGTENWKYNHTSSV